VWQGMKKLKIHSISTSFHKAEPKIGCNPDYLQEVYQYILARHVLNAEQCTRLSAPDCLAPGG
jgi:hypothetical protein